jgi:organic hydroperoxide reductase OsmC/OhrA
LSAVSYPSGLDPEEALVAALSSYHMLFPVFRRKRRLRGHLIRRPRQGIMNKAADGREWMTKVTLRPRVVFEGDKRPTAVEAETLHHESHEACYITNSVKTEILIEEQAEGLL